MEGKSLRSAVLLSALFLLQARGVSASSYCDGALRVEAPNSKSEMNCIGSLNAKEAAHLIELGQLPGPKEKIQIASRYLEEVDPFSIPVREALLNIYLESEDRERAYLEYQTIRKLDRDYFSGEDAAKILIRARKFSEALGLLDTMIQKVPGDLTARKLRAVARYEAKNHRGALDDLNLFVGSSEASDVIDLARAKTLYRLGQVNAARELLRELDWSSLEAHAQTFEFGLLAEKLEEHELAERSYRLCYEQAQREQVALALARAMQGNAKGEEAELLLHSALHRWPSSDPLMSALVGNLVSRGKVSRAGALLEAWKVKFPGKAWIQQEQAKLKARIGLGSPRPGNVSIQAPSPAKKTGRRRLATGTERVRVRSGETLMTLSYRLYGTHQRWREIWKLNKDELRSPSLIEARMLLKVPAVSEEPGGGAEE